jgi:hypothetical protein
MTIKYLLFIVLSLVLSLSNAQTNNFQNAQAIAQEQMIFYDAEGYAIFKQELPYSYDQRGIEKFKKKFFIPKDVQPTEDNDFPETKILTTIDTHGDTKTESIYYITQNGQGNIRVICFSTLCDRVKNIEKTYYDAIVSNTLPKEVFTPMKVDKVQFAGREIQLGAACRWMGVRNLQCPDMGQMNWSEFSSLERAKQMTTGQRALNASMKMGEVLEDIEIDILFEGQPTKALKRKLKIQLPQFIMGGSNILIIYYVTNEVNGRYVSCVLSHYTDDIGAKKLPPLLSEVMQLKE